MPSGRCPHCKRHTIFEDMNPVPPYREGGRPKYYHQGLKYGTVALARCRHSDCQSVVYREYDPSDNENQLDIYPPVQLDVDEELPDRVKRSFQEALNTFVDGYWNPSAQATGRTLTDAMMELIPAATKPANWAEKGLKKQIEILVQQNVLPAVIGKWAQEVRAIRVLSEHGDEGKDWWASQQEATEILELAKWIFRYIFVLPEQIKERKERLKQQPASQAPQGSSAPSP